MSLAGTTAARPRGAHHRRAAGAASGRDVYNQFPAETKDYVPMVIAAAWLFLHPMDYGIRWPRVSTRPATIRLSQPTSIYELTICLGNYGSRDGYMRALRNLNPRWEPDSTIPAGSMLNATTRMAWLYRFNCTGGKRAALAKQLVQSNVQSALVRIGPMTPSPMPAAAATLTPPAAPARPSSYKVQRGETLTSISRKFGCDLSDFAKANNLKAPKYAIQPGQSLKLDGCKGEPDFEQRSCEPANARGPASPRAGPASCTRRLSGREFASRLESRCANSPCSPPMRVVRRGSR